MQARLYLPIIIALYALSVNAAFAQEVEPCACNDIGQIWLRALEVDAAVQSLDSSLKFNDEHPQKVYDERRVINGPLDWPQVEGKLVAALNKVLAEHAAAIFEVNLQQAQTKYSANENACTTKWPPEVAKEATPCQLKWLDVHEAVHRTNCTQEGTSWHSTVHNKILDEIQAYSAERDWLIAQENKFLQTCDYYSVRLQMDMQLPKPMGPRVLYGMDQPEVPHLDVPMHVSCDGGMKGDGEGVVKANWDSQNGPAHVSGSMYNPLEFQISGEIGSASPEIIHTTIQIVPKDSSFDMTVKEGPETVHAGSKTVGTETTTTAKMNRIPGRPGTMVRHSAAPNEHSSAVVDFSQLDQPVVCPVSPGGGSMTCHATLMVAERYRDARAANNKGFTVRQALDAIAAADHTVVAAVSSCHQTK
jgi:hypothetical protein